MALAQAVRLGGAGEKMHDELLRPTMGGRSASGREPWRPSSIGYPAFLGGPLTAAVLGIINGRRLGLDAERLVAIGLAGLFAFAVRVAMSPQATDFFEVRWFGGLAGVLVWLLVLAMQRKPFRAFLLGRAEPARLFGPGFAALTGCGLLELGVIYGLAR
ncbi:hypothetical protein [Krasilnikovia sp. M28-CT-15]|uniref:hypothetical protein n=1 Tax=Krasilnikovia sp. M28-CT-15 TaxID=3373540 RepID=UPI003876E901